MLMVVLSAKNCVKQKESDIQRDGLFINLSWTFCNGIGRVKGSPNNLYDQQIGPRMLKRIGLDESLYQVG